MRAVFAMGGQFRNPAEFAVLVTLANYARAAGTAYPSKTTIANHVGVTPRQVWRITAALEQRGFIAIERGAAPRGGNRYRLLFDPVSNALKPSIDLAIRAFDGLIPLLESAAEFFAGLPRPIQATAIAFGAVAAAVGPLAFLFGQLAISGSALVGAFANGSIGARGLSVEKIAERLSLSTRVVELYGTALKSSARIAEDSAKDLRAFRNAIGEQEIADAAAALVKREEAEKQHRDFLNTIGEQEIADHAAMLKAKEDLDRQYRDFMNEMGLRQMNADALAMQTTGVRLKNGLMTSLGGLPQTIMAALTGGGNVGKATGGLIGGGLVSGLTGSLDETTGLFANGIGKTLQDKLGKTLGSAFGAVLPGVGNILGSLAGGLFGKLFGGGEKKEVEKLRNQFLESAGGITELRRQAEEAGVTLEKLFGAKKVKDFEAAVRGVLGQLDDHKKHQEEINAVIEKYGLTVEQLGAKWRNQALSERALTIVRDYRNLLEATENVGLATEKVADEVIDYLRVARITGAEVPQELRPIIQSLIDQGRLFDENGIAITEMGQLGITCAQTMKEGFLAVVEAIQTLTAAITGIPREVDIAVNYTAGEFPAPPSEDRPPTLHQGGIIAHGGRFLNGSIGEVWLRALRGEGVLNRAATAMVGGKEGIDALNSGNWQSVFNGWAALQPAVAGPASALNSIGPVAFDDSQSNAALIRETRDHAAQTRALRSELKNLITTLPLEIASAVIQGRARLPS